MHPLLLAMMLLHHQNSYQISQSKPEKKESVVSVKIEGNEQQEVVCQKRKRSSDQDDEKPFVIKYY